MKKATSTFILLLFFFKLVSQSQECNCESTFHWMKKIFEENDAGFQYSLEQKEYENYELFNSQILGQIKQTKDVDSCQLLLNNWLHFFRTSHLGIYKIPNQKTETFKETYSGQEADDIIEKFKDWEKVDVDLDDFTNYLNSKDSLGLEGIWDTEPYKLGIIKQNNTYLGFIIEADNVYWRKNQVKLKIYEDNGKMSSIFYYRDHRGETYTNVELFEDNYLMIGPIILYRHEMKEKSMLAENYLTAITTTEPYFQKLNESTNLLRIPSFRLSYKPIIDSLINSHFNEITNTKNLIIDIRNNNGGSDISFENIIPLIYTNPIREIGVEYYSTTLNNQRMLDFVNDPSYGFDDDKKTWAKESYEILNSNLGEYINLSESDCTIIKFDTIFQYPQNVGIICNQQNASAAEQFLYLSKQSKKVKLFGETTRGCLDVSNMYFINSPDNVFIFYYALTKSIRLPNYPIDDIGIQPDYYLDENIPEYKWFEYIDNVFNYIQK